MTDREKAWLTLLGATTLVFMVIMACIAAFLLTPTQTATPAPAPLLLPTPVPASTPSGISNLHVEYILDASAGMKEQLPDGVNKAEAARARIMESLQTYHPETSVGLRVYGHRVPQEQAGQACNDIELVAPVAPGYIAQIVTWLRGYQPRGMAPLANSLQQAMADFTFDSNRINSIVVIGSGQDTCGQNPCEVAETLRKQGANVTIHIIGLDVDGSTREQLQCIVGVGGGVYFEAHTAPELKTALEQVKEEVTKNEVIEPYTPTPLPATDTPAPPPPTNTRVVKDTPTPLPSTDTPIPPSPTHTPIPTPTDTPAPTPIPTRPATILVAPVAGREFIGPNETIILQWMPIPGLTDDEYYVLDLGFRRGSIFSHDVHWLKDTSMQVPRYIYDMLGEDRMCLWTVTIYRRTGTRADGSPDGVPVGPSSDNRWFYWRTPAPPPPPVAPPTSPPQPPTPPPPGGVS